MTRKMDQVEVRVPEGVKCYVEYSGTRVTLTLENMMSELSIISKKDGSALGGSSLESKDSLDVPLKSGRDEYTLHEELVETDGLSEADILALERWHQIPRSVQLEILDRQMDSYWEQGRLKVM